MLRRRIAAQISSELGEIRDEFSKPQFYRTLATMVVGVTAGALAVNGVLIRHGFFSAGTSGVALIIYYLFAKPSLGILYALLNVPLFVIGWREYALRYVFISAIGVAMFSVVVDFTTWVDFGITNPLIAAIVAGILSGAGGGFYLREGGSAGGLDILAKYIRKRFSMPMGTTMNLVNALNLLAALIMRDIEIAFYSGVYMWVMAWSLEKVQSGMVQHRAVLIITREPFAACYRIQQELGRSVTYLHASGGRSRHYMKMLMTVINLYELGRLKQIMFDIDPGAFVTVMQASEVIGNKFQSFEDEGYRTPFTWVQPGAAENVGAAGDPPAGDIGS